MARKSCFSPDIGSAVSTKSKSNGLIPDRAWRTSTHRRANPENAALSRLEEPLELNYKAYPPRRINQRLTNQNSLTNVRQLTKGVTKEISASWVYSKRGMIAEPRKSLKSDTTSEVDLSHKMSRVWSGFLNKWRVSFIQRRCTLLSWLIAHDVHSVRAWRALCALFTAEQYHLGALHKTWMAHKRLRRQTLPTPNKSAPSNWKFWTTVLLSKIIVCIWTEKRQKALHSQSNSKGRNTIFTDWKLNPVLIQLPVSLETKPEFTSEGAKSHFSRRYLNTKPKLVSKLRW